MDISYDQTRAVRRNGILINGLEYECVPSLIGDRIAILEDNKDHLIISAYKSPTYGPTVPVGPKYRVNLKGLGRPTIKRINALKEVLDSKAKLVYSL
jgi:hypothetical protein